MRILPKARDWPIRRKLMLLILITAAVSVVLVMGGIYAYELTTYRTRLMNEVRELGGFIAANSAASLAFDDRQAAQETLDTLEAAPAVAVGGLYTVDGRLFASFARHHRPLLLPPVPGPERLRFDFSNGRLELVRKVQKRGRTLGFLYLGADPASLYQRLLDYTGIFAIASLAIVAGAFLLQRSLQRLISDPLLRMAGAAESIAGGDLTTRFPEGPADEIGQLAGAFNHMTSQLAHSNEVLRNRTEELRRAKDELELRVRERTSELERTYRELQRQSEERVVALENLRKNEQLLLQQSRLAAMGEMLGNIAHQWRQPLNDLALILQDLAMDYELGELAEGALRDAVSSAMELILHMSQTIDDFRHFLQPDKERVRFNLNEAIAATLSLFEATLKTMEVELQVKESEQLFIEGYRNEFTQVIMNLVTNARDVFQERKVKSPRLVIELFRQDLRSVVTVTDNAGGIPETIIDKIFDPYFTTKGPDKGTGIGLFMSKTIIEKSMNGSLTVRNTAEGAQFRIEV